MITVYSVFLKILVAEKNFKTNLAWYQRTCFNFKNYGLMNFFIKVINIIIVAVAVYYLIYLYDHTTVKCMKINTKSFLNSYIVNNKFIYTFGDISHIMTRNIMNDILANINHCNEYQILKFRDLNNTKFPYNHPFSHPHLNILNYNSLTHDVYVSIQMSSHNFNNCFYFNKTNILGYDDQ